MRYVLMLALSFTCLSAAADAADPLTKRNNDASLRKHVKQPTVAPAPVVKPIPEDLRPTR